jgi:hypothetical protein
LQTPASGPGQAPVEEPDQQRTWIEAPESQPAAAGSAGFAQTTFEGLVLSLDRSQLRASLEQYVASYGLSAAEACVARYTAQVESGAGSYSRESISSEADLFGLDAAIGPLLQAEMDAIRAEVSWFLPEFEARGQLVAMALLDESQRRISAERERYGLTSKTTTLRVDTGFERGRLWRDVTTTTYGMADAEASRGLAAVAASLVAKHAEIVELRGEQLRLGAPQLGLLTGRGAAYSSTPSPETRAAMASLAERIRDRQRDYDIFRASAEQRYPILATFAGDPGGGAMAALAQGVSPDAAAVLEPIIAEKLSNIATARLALSSGELPIWKLPVIVDLTRVQLSIESGSMYDRLVRDTVQQIEADERWVQAALSALGIALALVGLLAAPFTGGSSFGVGLGAAASIAGGGLSAYLIYEEIQQYQLDAAASGTDFDKARALSMADPSLFWLALDILGTVADVFDAAQAFKVMRQAVRAAAEARRIAADAAEMAARLDDITVSGNQISPGLGDRIRARVEADEADSLFDDDLTPIDPSLLTPEERSMLEAIEADEAAQLTQAGPSPLQVLPTGAGQAFQADAARQLFEGSLFDVWWARGGISDQRQLYHYYAGGAFDLVPTHRNPFQLSSAQQHEDRIFALGASRPATAITNPQDRAWSYWHFFREGMVEEVGNEYLPTVFPGERIYLSTPADRAMDVMDFVVKQIVDQPAAFPGVIEAKVAGTDQVSRRFDSIVIYLTDQSARDAVLREISAYQGLNPGSFVDYSLPMTEPRFAGVAVAAQPLRALGDSVGDLYAQAVYKALTDALSAGDDFAGFKQRVLAELRARGIDPDLPHRLGSGGR